MFWNINKCGLINTVIVIFLSLMMSKSFAFCDAGDVIGKTVDLKTVGKVDRPRDTENKLLVDTVSKSVGTTYYCDTSTAETTALSYSIDANGAYAGEIGGKSVYKTDIDGLVAAIGFSVVDETPGGLIERYTLGRTRPYTLDTGTHWLTGSTGSKEVSFYNNVRFALVGVQRIGFTIYAELYQMGTLESVASATNLNVGVIKLSAVGTHDGSQSFAASNLVLLPNNRFVDVSVAIRTCTPKHSALDIQLPDSITNRFAAGIGAKDGLTSFNLGFSCDKNVTVKGEFSTSSAVLDVANTVLGKTGDTVGIQVLYQDKPLTLNEQLTFGSNAGSASDFNLPLQARYYRSSMNSVEVGSIRATLSYVMEYH